MTNFERMLRLYEQAIYDLQLTVDDYRDRYLTANHQLKELREDILAGRIEEDVMHQAHEEMQLSMAQIAEFA